jgi:hypothetical protein
MSAADLRLFEYVAGPLLVESGYDLASTGEMTAGEWARLQSLRLKYETLQFGRKIAQKAGLVPPI